MNSNSVVGWILGIGCLVGATLFVRRRQWAGAGLCGVMAAAAFAILFVGSEFDVFLDALVLLPCFLYGIAPWSKGGQRFAESVHLSVGGAKALGAFFLFLGLVLVFGHVIEWLS